MLLNREFSKNMRVITSVLIQLHKFIISEITLEVTVPKPMTGMILIAWYMHLLTFKNITAPVPHKWKNNDNIPEEYKKFHHSCQRIFDGPMAHVTNGKVKTNMFLIWCRPDREDIYDNSELEEHEMYDIDHIMEQFELYCEPSCNVCAARYKF